jgi:hypothetical protein
MHWFGDMPDISDRDASLTVFVAGDAALNSGSKIRIASNQRGNAAVTVNQPCRGGTT